MPWVLGSPRIWGGEVVRRRHGATMGLCERGPMGHVRRMDVHAVSCRVAGLAIPVFYKGIIGSDSLRSKRRGVVGGNGFVISAAGMSPERIWYYWCNYLTGELLASCLPSSARVVKSVKSVRHPALDKHLVVYSNVRRPAFDTRLSGAISPERIRRDMTRCKSSLVRFEPRLLSWNIRD